MCRVGHCYWYQEGPAATFLLAAHPEHRFEIFFQLARGFATNNPKVACTQVFGEDVVANDASSDAGGSDAGEFLLLSEAAQGSLFDNEPNGHDGEGLPLEGVKLYWHVIAT